MSDELWPPSRRYLPRIPQHPPLRSQLIRSAGGPMVRVFGVNPVLDESDLRSLLSAIEGADDHG